MLKVETNKNELKTIEVSGEAAELLADVCVVVTNIAHKLLDAKDKENSVEHDRT